MEGIGHFCAKVIHNQQVCAVEPVQRLGSGGDITAFEFHTVVLVKNRDGSVIGHGKTPFGDTAGNTGGQEGFAQSCGAI